MFYGPSGAGGYLRESVLNRKISQVFLSAVLYTFAGNVVKLLASLCLFNFMNVMSFIKFALFVLSQNGFSGQCFTLTHV